MHQYVQSPRGETDSDPESPNLARFHREALILDIHMHGRSLMPPILRPLGRIALGSRWPGQNPIGLLSAGGFKGGVLAAVGDLSWYRALPPGRRLAGVQAQLTRLKSEVLAIRGRIVTSAAEARKAFCDRKPFFFLGLEGADPLTGGADELKGLHRAGVRIVSLVHLTHGPFGSATADARSYWRAHPRPPAQRGLTARGEALVRDMNDLGLVLDLAHADEETAFGALAKTRKPVVISHAGARALSPFHRFISDDLIRAVADSGGVIGLWPMFFLGRGVPDARALTEQAAHILRITGPDHLAMGTDFNGVPGLMKGYRGPADAPVLTRALFEAGLDETGVRKAWGLNFLRVLRDTVGQ